MGCEVARRRRRRVEWKGPHPEIAIPCCTLFAGRTYSVDCNAGDPYSTSKQVA